MINQLNIKFRDLHLRAIELCRRHRELEWQIVSVLTEIDRLKLYEKLGRSSLFQYAVGDLKLTESVAYAFISVARKSKEIVQLRSALSENKISVSKASRLVAAINSGNADGLLQFAQSHSGREIDAEVARLNPEPAARDRIKQLSEELVELKVTVRTETMNKLRRIQKLAAPSGKPLELASILDLMCEEYLNRKDPIRKASRVSKQKSELCAHRVAPQIHVGGEALKPSVKEPKPSIRRRLTAAETHAVNRRDGGCCTFIDSEGKRCTNERWLHMHHIRPVSLGGSNSPDNLTTLCSFHHDLVHQLSLPLEGQVTWLRSPRRLYSIEQV
jgi:hypothetical protein